MSIFNYVPSGYKLRDVQRQVLQEIEDAWEEHDAIIVDAPVASGKSLISMIIAEWRNAVDETAAILTPKTLLQDQYQRDFPEVPSLKGKSKYSCMERGYETCGDFYEVAEFYCCGECPYKTATKKAAEAEKVILNFHSHLFGGLAHDSYKDNLIIDEAHNLVPMLSDIYSLNIWLHKENYPADTHTKDDVIQWLEGEIETATKAIKQGRAIYDDYTKMPKAAKTRMRNHTRKLQRYKMLKEGLMMPQELFNIAKTQKPYGRPIKGRQQLKECIEVCPVSLKTVPHHMWPDGSVKKIILLSASLYDKDIDRLGLTRKRVKYIKCDSPIPAANRPIVVDRVAKMSYNERQKSAMLISNKIKQLAERHPGKGVVHLTYSLVKEFKKHLKGRRYSWHTEETREQAYNEFIEADDNRILMACGMGEGIDLAGSDYEWQVIAKVVFPNINDPVQQHFIHKDKLVYDLETVRITVQQAGRICRTPTDTGVTYILDSSFATFYMKNYKLFPGYFQEALKWEKL